MALGVDLLVKFDKNISEQQALSTMMERKFADEAIVSCPTFDMTVMQDVTVQHDWRLAQGVPISTGFFIKLGR